MMCLSCVGFMEILLPPECSVLITYPNGEIEEFEVVEPMIIVVPIGTVITVFPINGWSYNITCPEEKVRLF